MMSAFRIVLVFVLLYISGLVGCSSKEPESSDMETRQDAGSLHDDIADSDNDGVSDTEDAFPKDAYRAALLADEFDVGAVYANNVYVSPTGNDTSGDGSKGKPYKTVSHAAGKAVPGTKINLLAGKYPVDKAIINLHGTASKPVAIIAEGEVVFDAGGVEDSLLRFSDPRFVVLQGFTLQNSLIHGINIDDGGGYDTPAEHVIIRNLTFRNIGVGGNHDCLKMSGVDRFMVLNSRFDDCDHGEAIDMVGCHQGIIRGNVFSNIPINAINTKGGSADILIEANRFSDVRERAINAGGSTGKDYFRPIDAPHEAARIRMLSNIIERTGVPVAFTGCDHCVFANNTIIYPKTHMAAILQESTDKRFVPSRHGQFVNNLIVFNQSDVDENYVRAGKHTAPETFTFGNNFWYALDDSGFTGPSFDRGVPPETSSVNQRDPQFNLAGGDYHITLSSPAAGRGRAVPGGITHDFDGLAVNNPIDIGAFRASP